MAAIPELSETLRRLASSESAAYLTSGLMSSSSDEQPASSAPVQGPGYSQGGGVDTVAGREVSGAVASSGAFLHTSVLY